MIGILPSSCTPADAQKWNLTEVSSHDEAISALKNCLITLQQPLSTRRESFNRTRWLDKLKPADASQEADGPEGPMAPIVTTGVLFVEKPLLTRHLCARGHISLSVSFHRRSTICACHPCARAMHFFTISWSRNFRNAKRPSSCFAVLKKKKTCPIFQPISTLSNFACHPCTKGHAKFLCAKKKTCN